MPLAYQSAAKSDRRRSDFALPSQRFLFVQVVDAVASRRANVMGLVEAFRRAFPADRPSRPGLVVCMTGGRDATDVSQSSPGTAIDDDGVFVIGEALPRQDVAALISLCDAAVSLHRAEGVALFVADAMLLGRPVIATDYSATTDLVTPATGFPVDCRPTPAAPTAPCAEQPEIWAEPDLDHAAWLMRRLAAHPDHGEPYVARGHELLRRNHGPEHVAARHLARLRDINFDV